MIYLEAINAFEENILLDIKGLRQCGGDNETVSFTVAGMLTGWEGKYVIAYEDEHSGEDGAHTEITVEDDSVSMIRTGESSTDMYFRRNTPYSSCYRTPFGDLDLTVLPTLVKTDMGPKNGSIELEYILNIAGSQIVNKLQLSYKKEDGIFRPEGESV